MMMQHHNKNQRLICDFSEELFVVSFVACLKDN